jgi:hypothetical protein
MRIEKILDESFFVYKQTINIFKSAVENHFRRVVHQVEAGLPDVEDDKSDEEEDDF